MPQRELEAVTTIQRGPGATGKLLRAVLELGTQFGFDAVTIERIADHTGVAKTTIYRRWPNVSAIVMDAFLSEVTKAAPLVEKATVRESLSASMKQLARYYRGKHNSLVRTLLARAQLDEELRDAVKTRWVEPRRKIAREIIERGISRGELRDGLDVDVVLDVLHGPIYHRLLVPYGEATISDRYIDTVIETVFDGLTKSQLPTALGGGETCNV